MAASTALQPRIVRGVPEAGRYTNRVHGEAVFSLAPQGDHRGGPDPKYRVHGHLESMRSVVEALEAKAKSGGFKEHDRQQLLSSRKLHGLLAEAVSSVSSDAEAVRFLMWKHDQELQKAADVPGSRSLWPWVRRSAEREARSHRALAHDARERAQQIDAEALQQPAAEADPAPAAPAVPEVSPRRRADALLGAIQGHVARLHRLSPEYARARVTLGVLSEASKGAGSDQEVVAGLRRVYEEATAQHEAASLEAGRAATFQEHQEYLRKAERARAAIQDAVELRNRLVPLANAAHTLA